MIHLIYRSALALCFALILTTTCEAQNVITPTTRVGWDQHASSLTIVQSYEYKVYIDSATTGVVLTGVTCTGVVSPFLCDFLIGTQLPTGNHTITFTATNQFGESLKSLVWTYTTTQPGQKPTRPTAVRKTGNQQ